MLVHLCAVSNPKAKTKQINNIKETIVTVWTIVSLFFPKRALSLACDVDFTFSAKIFFQKRNSQINKLIPQRAQAAPRGILITPKE